MMMPAAYDNFTRNFCSARILHKDHFLISIKKTDRTPIGMRSFLALYGNSLSELFRDLVDADLFLILAYSLETDDAVLQRKEGVILATTDIDTGMDLGAPLSDENIARENKLTVRALGTEPLRRTVSTVPRATYALLMSE